eukprot:5203329-Pyramimonas_sp.AAC.1
MGSGNSNANPSPQSVPRRRRWPGRQWAERAAAIQLRKHEARWDDDIGHWPNPSCSSRERAWSSPWLQSTSPREWAPRSTDAGRPRGEVS